MSNPRIRLLIFFGLAALGYILMVFGGGKREKKITPLEKVRKIFSKPDEKITFGDIADVIDIYKTSPINSTERKEIRKNLERIRRVYVDLWQAELERRRRIDGPSEYYRVETRGSHSELILLSGNFTEEQVKSLTENVGWIKTLKLLGFKELSFGNNRTFELR